MDIHIKFPIILFSDSNNVQMLSDIRQVTNLTSLALKKGVLNNSLIIDSNEKFYRVKEVTKIKDANPWWQFEYFNRMVKVELDLEHLNAYSLEQTKQLIISAIKENYEFWSSYDDVENITNRISSLRSTSEIIKYLGKMTGLSIT